jgi:hypothetical protein
MTIVIRDNSTSIDDQMQFITNSLLDIWNSKVWFELEADEDDEFGIDSLTSSGRTEDDWDAISRESEGSD